MSLERAFRLLPSERVLWHGAPESKAPRPTAYTLGALLLGALAAIAASFSALLSVTELGGARQIGIMAAYLALLATAVLLAPHYLHAPCKYLVTEHRVMWRRGQVVRWIDRRDITYARITWLSSMPGVGHIELVRATPFGPLARRQRIELRSVIAPDRLYAMIRDVEPKSALGDPDLPLTDRLDVGERVLWGDGPRGYLLGWRDVLTTALGAVLLLLALRYGAQAWGALIELERHGLRVQSLAWLFLFTAITLSFSVIACVGSALAWHGLIRARAMGHDTEYVVTNRRVLIRRGRTELSIDRRRIVDVAVVPVADGCRHLYLILDAPEARALSDSGAMLPLSPARDLVPPVLYELRDTDGVCALLLSPSDDQREAA
jgi:diadenosine tetraphosphatase ApaH/serine/threonine PP2A family protein phosphatase